MDWVLLVYGVIFGLIGAYLLTLWQRLSKADAELRRYR